MSLSDKTKKWLAANCRPSLRGKTVLITGANSGIGFKTAETMVYLGASVIMACRNLQRAEEARNTLLQEYPKADISIMHLDLADLSSLDSFVRQIRTQAVDIDLFLNNAGVFHQPGKKTADGFELVIGSNYFGVYYLTERILPYLVKLPHEVILVNTISMIHKIAQVEYGDFFYSKNYENFHAYARSKLCLARYSYALAKRMEGSNIRVLMNHPGMALTPMGLNAYGLAEEDASVIVRHLLNSPEKSSLSIAYILSHYCPPGSLIGPNKGFGGWGYPEQNKVCRKVKKGSEQLIVFTNRELKKALKNRDQGRRERKNIEEE